MEGRFWKRCNTCKSEIGYATDYYVCSVSTCNRKGTDFSFCTIECWEAHLPSFRHREAWGEERRSTSPRRATGTAKGAPTPPSPRVEAPRPVAAAPRVETPPPVPGPPRAEAPRPVAASPTPAPSSVEEELPPLELRDRGEIPEDILVVASKLKAYIRARSGMNTSDGVLNSFSHVLRDLCDDAIERAHASGRKTVMDRDLP